MMPSKNNYELSKEEIDRVFKERVLPSFKNKYKIQESKDLTAYFTAGVPGAGKSSIVKELKNKNPGIPVIDMDNLRRFHPDYKDIMKKDPLNMANHTNEAAYQWAMALREEVIKSRSDFVFDSSLRTASNVEHYITSKDSGVTKDGYNAKVVMIAATKYEALQGALKRYLQQYEKDPSQARYVDINFIEKSTETIKEAARKIEEMVNKSQIKEFQIRTREGVVIFDTSRGDKDAYKALDNYYDLSGKYWNKERRDNLKKAWNQNIEKLDKTKIPKNDFDKIKEIGNNLKKEINNAIRKEFKNKQRDTNQPSKEKDKSKGFER